MSSESHLAAARTVLRRTFGHADFRGLQGAVIEEVLAGRSAIAVLPTGGGKSLCYQIPSLIRPGLGLVVSPLIALMTDQVAALQQSGVAAARLDSSTDPAERAETWRRIEAGELALLYLSPEGLMQPWMLERLARLDIALVAIDEAHCVSQWGHDFRPEYRTLGRLAEIFPNAPRLAVTATADARTRRDIAAELKLEDAKEFVAEFFARPELILSAERKQGRGRKRVLELVAARPGRAGVIYSGSRDGADEMAASLVEAGVPALAYHAGLDKKVRAERLDRFLRAEDAVMVATIAFGMGVDKPDVRFVIHADPPASIEAYWQEIGRAGRDSEPAEGITLYGAADLSWALRRLDSRELTDEVRQVQTRKARQLYTMLDGVGCRAAAVRRYFGETGVEPCGQCDLCLTPPETIDATEAAQKALSAVHRLGGKFGRGRVIEHLLGKTKEPSGFERGLSTFGVGQELNAAGWRDLIDQLLFDGLFREDPNDGRPLLGLGEADGVRAVYRGERRVQLRRPTPATEARAGRPRRGRETVTLEVADQPLFEALRAWRREAAAQQAVPPYVIFHDRTLAEIAETRPRSSAALARIGGVGQGKLERYGPAVLALVAREGGDGHDHDEVHDHDWKHAGVRVIPGDQLDPNTAQTPGMDRAAAINFARVGAEKLWAGTVTIHPNAKTGAHHHGALESVIYVLRGRARMRWGEALEFVAEAGPGDFIYVPPFVPHQEINASPDEALECVLVRSGGEAVVVNLDIAPVEPPEAVAWVDSIHKPV